MPLLKMKAPQTACGAQRLMALLPADVRLPNLEELRLQNYDTVAAEAHLPALKRLYVRGLKLDDLRAVQKHPKLECLVVDSASVTSLEDLRGHPSLQALNAPFASDIRAVSSLPRLRSLVLSRRVADVSPVAYAKLTEVFVDVPDVPMSTFHNMTNLKHVAIGRWAAATLDAKAFGKDGRGITVAHSEQKAPWAAMPLLQKSCGGLAELGWR